MWLPLTSLTSRAPTFLRRVDSELRYVADPRPRCVDDRARRDAACVVPESDDPQTALGSEGSHRRPRRNARTRVARGDRVEHDETRVIDGAVPIGEGVLQFGRERRAGRIDTEIDRPRTAKRAACRQMIVEKQSGAYQHPRPHARSVR